jgi:hypothetical protein
MDAELDREIPSHAPGIAVLVLWVALLALGALVLGEARACPDATARGFGLTHREARARAASPGSGGDESCFTSVEVPLVLPAEWRAALRPLPGALASGD